MALLRTRWPAVVIGLLLLVAVGVVTSWAVSGRQSTADGSLASRSEGLAAALRSTEAVLPLDGLGVFESQISYGLSRVEDDLGAPVALAPDARVEGEVRRPAGGPAAGATVTLYRQLTAWPEWKRAALDVAITGVDGKFQFEVRRRPDLLIGFEHPGFAGGLQEAPANTPLHVLTLKRGFDLEGVVTSGTGPVPRAVVFIESTAGDLRRVRSVTTDASGRFGFTNVAIGTVRVVARHEMFEPVIQPAVVIGMERLLQLRFDKLQVSLEGRVFAGATQEPVVGAEVLALRQGQRLGLNAPIRAQTRSDGSFRLTGLARGNLRIWVRHRDYAVSSRTLVVGPSPLPVVIDLQPRVRIAGVLVKSDAYPLPLSGTVLTFRSSADEIVQAVVQDDGSFDFAETVSQGNGRLAIPDGTFAFRASQSSAMPLLVDESRGHDLQLDVRAPAIVLGRVRDANGDALEGSRVTVSQRELVTDRFLRAGSALLSANLLQLGDQFRSAVGDSLEVLLAVTDEAGAFRIVGQPPGKLGVVVAHPGHGSRRIEISVPEGDGIVEIPDAMLPRACFIGGRVSRSGRPLAGARVDAVVEGAQISVVSDLDGNYLLRDLPPGMHRVRARYSTLRTEDEVQASPEQPAVLDLVFEPGRMISGTVSGSEGQAVEGAMVGVYPRGSPVTTDSSGSFQLEVPEGDIELRVAYSDRATAKRHRVAATQREVTLAVDTPAMCTISARVLGLPGRKIVSGILLRITDLDEDPEFLAAESRWVETRDGMLHHPWFPAGSWHVMLQSEGYAPFILDLDDLASGTEKELGEILLQPGCALRGVVVDEAGGAVSGARVFLGEEADLDLFEPQLQTGDDGSFELIGVASAARTLVVRAPGYAWQAIELSLPYDVLKREPMRIQLDRGSTIIALLGPDSEDVRYVELYRNGRLVTRAEVDADGKALFANRARGTYELRRYDDDRAPITVTIEQSGKEVQVDLQ